MVPSTFVPFLLTDYGKLNAKPAVRAVDCASDENQTRSAAADADCDHRRREIGDDLSARAEIQAERRQAKKGVKSSRQGATIHLCGKLREDDDESAAFEPMRLRGTRAAPARR
jgi:hypothetical protein